MTSELDLLPPEPDLQLPIRDAFAVDVDGWIPAFRQRTHYVPPLDGAYRFDPVTTMAILAGFRDNRRVMVQGRHGTGKSSHIEQVAARLNWPCIRVNLDSHISRIDLIGKDAIVIEDGKQVTRYREGILPWAYQHPVALVFDEYDAGRPDVMFVIQRVLEAEGRLTILDQNRVVLPHPSFRLFCTTNTVGLGDASGLYQGTQLLNQAQLDRWSVIARLSYLSEEDEVAVVAAKVPLLAAGAGREAITRMVRMAEQTRIGFEAGDVSTVMSPRTVIFWAENYQIFGDIDFALCAAFLNRCDDAERATFAEYFQRVFGKELSCGAPLSWRRADRPGREGAVPRKAAAGPT